jgi:hypothetical protein
MQEHRRVKHDSTNTGLAHEQERTLGEGDGGHFCCPELLGLVVQILPYRWICLYLGSMQEIVHLRTAVENADIVRCV